MKWPFLILPRSVYDDQQAASKARDDANTKRINELTNTIIDLKMSGAQVVRHTGIRLEPKEETEIERVIRENKHARRDPRVARALQKYADDALADGKPESEVLEKLANWDRVESVDDDDLDDELRAMGDG